MTDLHTFLIPSNIGSSAEFTKVVVTEVIITEVSDVVKSAVGTERYVSKTKSNSYKKNIIVQINRKYQLILLLLPALVYIIVFNYFPLYGIQLAFKKYMAVEGIWNSPWVGLRNFETFFKSDSFMLVMKNTLGMTLYSLVAGFPIPIILALMLHNLPGAKFRKVVQMVSYAPHFLSVVVVVGIMNVMLNPTSGVVNKILEKIGEEPVFFMAVPELFSSTFVWSGIWQHVGFSSIIFIAALSGIDPSLYEAATVDGANRLKRILHIDIPGIMPTAIVLLILNSGQMLNVAFEKVFLMQNPLNIRASEVISTYVYRVGIQNGSFEFGTAVGLFNSFVSAIILISVNLIARRYNSTSLF